MKQTFDADSIYGQYSIDGKHLHAKSFSITKHGQNVASITNKSSGLYAIHIYGHENDPFVLTVILTFLRYISDSKEKLKQSAKIGLKQGFKWQFIHLLYFN